MRRRFQIRIHHYHDLQERAEKETRSPKRFFLLLLRPDGRRLPALVTPRGISGMMVRTFP